MEEKKATECFNFKVLYLCHSYTGIFAEVKELYPDFETENNSSVMLVEPSSALPWLTVNCLLHK